MDQRLKEVRQTDLAEGRLNEEFLDWLKTKGVSWLLVVMVALCVYFGIVRWRSHQENFQAEGWQALTTAATPTALEEVAEKYADVDAVPLLARLNAAQQFMSAVQAGRMISSDDAAPPVPLSESERDSYLDRADRLYSAIVSSDDGSAAKTLFVVNALNGRAAVAESRGTLDEARALYEQAAARAEGEFPALAAQARANAVTVDQQEHVPPLLSVAEVSKLSGPPPSLEPVQVDLWLSDMLLPETEESDG